MGLAASPATAEDTGFKFDEWFQENVVNNENSIPEVEIDFADSGQRNWIHCETRAPYEETPWCNGGWDPYFIVKIKDGDSAPTEDLKIGIEWATATGQTGYGEMQDRAGRAIIPAGQSRSVNFNVAIPNDTIAHSCNKLIVSLRSLQPGKYKIAPWSDGKGFKSLEYVDDDGKNLGLKPCEP